MDLGLEGKIAMVTGGSHGLGYQIASCLAREGCYISICARDKRRVDEVVAGFVSNGSSAHGSQADVTIESDINRFYEETLTALGQPDILINNVGGRRGSVHFDATSMEQFIAGLDLNLISAVRLTKLVIDHMKEQKWGRIINISSISGREYGGSIDYMTAKAGLIAFSKHLALQSAPFNVLVNCVAPGSIDFPGSTWDRFQRIEPPDVVEEFISRNLPMGRFGWPEPIGETVAFLASDKADLITGACINIDGGQSRSLI
jgi:3-oxoacyl-[acyl-carrier protein] reductase